MDNLNIIRLWALGLDQRTNSGPIERPKTIATDGSGILSPFFLFSNGDKIKPQHKQTLEWEYHFFTIQVLGVNLRSILRTHIKEMQIIHHIFLNDKNNGFYILISGTSDIDFLYSKIFTKKIYVPGKENLYYDVGMNIHKTNVIPSEFSELYKELEGIS